MICLIQQVSIRGERRKRSMEPHTIRIDLSKTVFHLVGLNQLGEVVVWRKFSRKQLLHPPNSTS
jgi:hypothetical protein